MSVIVAVVSYNTRALLERCLRSLATEPVEAVVVDNGSTDGSPDAARALGVPVVEPGENLGYGRAVNLVASTSDADWVAPANADVALRPGAIDALLRAAEADPGAGAFAPRLVLPDGTDQHSVHPFPTPLLTLGFNLGLGHVLGDRWCIEGRWDSTAARRVPWALGAFLLVRRQAWDLVGGFDPDQWMYAEDVDLGWRLARAGWATRYVPDAVVDHESAASTSAEWGEQRRDRWLRETYRWSERRLGPRATRFVATTNVAGAAAREAIWRARRDAWRAQRERDWRDAHRRAFTPPRAP